MFKNIYIYTFQCLFSSLLIVLFTGCSSSSGEDGGGDGPVHKPTLLAIYVYAPEQAAVKRNAAQTRADVGEVDPITNEGISVLMM